MVPTQRMADRCERGTITPIFIDRKAIGNDILYYYEVVKTFSNFIERYDYDDLLIEDYAFRAVGKVFSIGEFVGILKLVLTRQMNTFCVVSPTMVKKAIYKGNAKKEELFRVFCDMVDSSKIIVSNEWYDDVLSIYNDVNGGGDKLKSPLSDILDSFYIAYFRNITESKKTNRR